MAWLRFPLFRIRNPELVAPKTAFSFLIANQEEQEIV
jgi:hypothetical protein